MLSAEIINDLIPPLKTSDSGDRALSLMEDFKISHIPIVNDTEFLGLISEDDIIEMPDTFEPISTISINFHKPYVHDWQHIYDVMKLMSDMKLSVVPVLDEHDQYLGIISVNTMVDYFARITSLESQGAVIVIEVDTRNYLLSEIARIVESNDAHILSSYIDSDRDSTKIKVTIKVDKEDVGGIVQTFQRFNYTVSSLYKHKDKTDDTKERFDSFMRYLNT
ncbi:MAG: CBS domain-containing protein [bacterium]